MADVPRVPGWTDDELTAAVAASTSYYQVCQRLGLVPGKYTTLRRHIARLGVDDSHLRAEVLPVVKRRRSWTDEQLAEAIRDGRSVADVLRRLGYVPNGGVHRMIVRKIANLGLDTSHFTGQRWARGKTFGSRRAIPLEAILVANSTYGCTSRLRQRLIAAGLKEAVCEGCGLTEWQGRPLPLALDHINGMHADNRLENLRILCPNCHALTDTWCARKPKPKPAYSNWQRDVT